MLAVTLALAACVSPPADPEARAQYEMDNDPAEPTNRVIFAGNKFVDDHVMQPVARGYEDYVPSPVQNCIHNFVGNLGQPGIAVNDVLQGNFGRSWTTLQRFAINTTVGGAGLFDVATDWNRPGHLADFGQTLGVWGVPGGPYLVLPLLGPSNLRDGAGLCVDYAFSVTPFFVDEYILVSAQVVNAIDQRSLVLDEVREAKRTAFDYYIFVRDAYAQRRNALVEDSQAPNAATTEELYHPEGEWK